MSEYLLEVKNLKKYFKTKNGPLCAVDDISFGIRKGETLGVVGESGCGKSTAGRAILRLHEPTAGQILFNGQDIVKYSPKKMKEMRRKMQIVFQDPYSSLNPRLSVQALIDTILLEEHQAAASGAEIEALGDGTDCDLILMDIEMEATTAGIKAARQMVV